MSRMKINKSIFKKRKLCGMLLFNLFTETELYFPLKTLHTCKSINIVILIPTLVTFHFKTFMNDFLQ